MLWALGQPAAAIGLAVAFLLGLVVRALGQRHCARLLGLPAGAVVARSGRVRDAVDPVGGSPPLLAALDLVGAPVLALWT